MSAPIPICPVCQAPAALAHPARIRNVEVGLYRCSGCGLRFFPEPDWLEALWSEAVSDLDIGLPLRCINLARIVEAIIRNEGMAGRPHLDWGGGYGLLTRLLRDRGIDMFHHDPFAENIFARGFERELDTRYGVVTAAEVFEHLEDPKAVLRAIAEHADAVIVSTVLVPDEVSDLRDWWYLGPSGQHITFYDRASLAELGRQCGYQLSTNGSSVHVFHRAPLSRLTRLLLRDVRFSPFVARGQRLLQRGHTLRDADAILMMEEFSPWLPTR